jgi:hypothetical protein
MNFWPSDRGYGAGIAPPIVIKMQMPQVKR